MRNGVMIKIKIEIEIDTVVMLHVPTIRSDLIVGMRFHVVGIRRRRR